MAETATKLVTYDDYLELPDDGNRYQIIGGELFMTPAPFTRHQQAARNIFRLLDNFALEHDLGEVFFAPFDVVLSMTDVVEPDILFIAKERLEIIAEKNIIAAPDLVVEVLSDSTEQIDRNQKKELYANHGVKEYWIADPKKETIEQFVLKDDQLELKATAGSKNTQFKSRLLKKLTVGTGEVFD